MSTPRLFEEAIAQLVPISRLNKARQKPILDLCEIKNYSPGDFVYQQGDDDDDLYYLLGGTVSLYWQGKLLKEIRADSIAAKRAFDRPGRKRHSIIANTAVTVAVIPSHIVEFQMREARLLSQKTSLEVSDITSQKSSNWMIRMLQSDLFSQLPATNIQNIFALMERYRARADERIVSQGDIGDYYYVIEQGYCEVTRNISDASRQIHLADLGPGDAFGEEALVADAERGATVTMLVDGVLMRLEKAHFRELIQAPLLKSMTVEQALQALRGEVRLIDIRYPEERTAPILSNAENIPFNVIRIKAHRLDREYEYIVCGNISRQSAVAAFLLLERGVSVRYLDAPVGELIQRLPSGYQAESKETGFSERLASQNMRTRPSEYGNTLIDESIKGEAGVSSEEAIKRLETTIQRIDRIYQDKADVLEAQHKIPPRDYAQTATGQRLADLIDDMEHSQRVLNNGTTGAEDELAASSVEVDMDVTGGSHRTGHLSATANPNILLVDTNIPLPVDINLGDAMDNVVDDPLARMMREFESKIRRQLNDELGVRSRDIEARYKNKLARLQRAAAIEVKKRQDAYKQKMDLRYKQKELILRKHYQKLMALANKVTAQKAQLQDAKRQFEDKLHAANALYKEVEDMRMTLKEHLGGDINIRSITQGNNANNNWHSEDESIS